MTRALARAAVTTRKRGWGAVNRDGAAAGTGTGAERIWSEVARASTVQPVDRWPQWTQRKKMAPGAQPTPYS